MATTLFLISFAITLVLLVPSQASSIVAKFNIYHRHSDKVTGVLGGTGLPKQGTVEYYSVWITHDQHRHRLYTTQHLPALTFASGAVTTFIQNLGNLHYAEIRVGTPPVSFLVAIDTGSDITWLPCGCTDCARFYETDMGQTKILSSYSPKSSNTSAIVSCDSPECWPKKQCQHQSGKPCP